MYNKLIGNKKEKKDKNYLTFIPIKSKKIKYKVKSNGNVQLIVPRDSLIEKIAIKLFFAPENLKIDLDEIGSFIWSNIDGNNNIYQIGKLVEENFGEKAEPLYERLVQYINILKSNDFIKFIE